MVEAKISQCRCVDGIRLTNAEATGISSLAEGCTRQNHQINLQQEISPLKLTDQSKHIRTSYRPMECQDMCQRVSG